MVQTPIPCLYTKITRDIVPVIVAFTKFDAYIFVKGIESQSHENGRTQAYAHHEEWLRPFLRSDKIQTSIVHGNLRSFLRSGS